jgi:AIPR protein
LQTSTEVFKFFQANPAKEDERNILVRVIAADTADSQDKIIKATNSQTTIPAASLHATEKIHRDIEQFLKSYGLYYDRRKNFYKNEGKGIDKIISIPYLAQAVMAIALQRPDTARARPSSLLKDESDYEKVFSEGHPIQLYAGCALIMKRVDAYLRSEELGLNRKDQTNLRFYVGMLGAMRQASGKSLTSRTVAALAVEKLTDSELAAALNQARAAYEGLGSSDQAAKGPELLRKLKPPLTVA